MQDYIETFYKMPKLVTNIILKSKTFGYQLPYFDKIKIYDKRANSWLCEKLNMSPVEIFQTKGFEIQGETNDTDTGKTTIIMLENCFEFGGKIECKYVTKTINKQQFVLIVNLKCKEPITNGIEKKN